MADRTVDSDDAPGLIGDSVRISVASAVSRVTGFTRIVVAASVLGSTVLGDLFVAINVLPLTLYDVFAGSAISSVLVPPLVRHLDRGDGEGARRLAANALGLVVAALAVVAGVAVLARGWLAAALTAGVEDALTAPARSVAMALLLWIVPQLALYGAIGVFVSIQHAHRHFLLPSAAPIVENLGLIATIVVVWIRYGGGVEVDGSTGGIVTTLVVGSGLSVAAHAGLQFVGAWRAAGSIDLGLDWRHPHIAGLARPARDSFGWSSVIAVRQFALVVAAAYAGAGGVQAFEIATLAYFIPVALVGRPIASAVLPRLARAEPGSIRLRTGYLGALRLAGMAAVPAGLALIVLAGPLAGAIGQGRFEGPETAQMLTYALAGLGLGAAADALFEVARQALMADGGSPSRRVALRRSSWVRAAVAVVGIPLVIATVDGPAVLLGLGLVVSLGDVAAFAIAHRVLRTGAADPGPRFGPRIVVAALTALGLAAAVAVTVPDRADVARAAVAIAIAIGGYMAVGYVVSGRGRMIRQLRAALHTEELT